MTEDLTAVKTGRVFVGGLERQAGGRATPALHRDRRSSAYARRHADELQVLTLGVAARRRHRAWRPSCSVTLPKDGKLHGLRRVTLARIGLASNLIDNIGTHVPTDAVVIVTGDRAAPGKLFDT
jgi:hypothetical protein